MNNEIYGQPFTIYTKEAKSVNIKNCQIFSFDIETHGLNARAFWFGVISWITKTNKGLQGWSKVFLTYNEMYKFILELSEKAKEKKVKLWMYGHNAEYDYAGIFKGNYFNQNIQYVFQPFIATINEYLIIDDSYSLFPMSLRRVGEIVNLEKFETPEDMKTGVVREITEKDIEYCIRDTVIVLKSIEFYKDTIEEIFGVRIKKMYTTPQITIKTFQTWLRLNDKEFKHKLFLENRINSSKDNFDVLRLAFRGGRVVAFKKGEIRKVTKLDVNSLYPEIMKELVLPNFTIEIKKSNVEIEKALEYLEYDGIIQCKIHVPNINIGYLPILYKDKQIYPNKPCVIKGVWTTLEVRNAIKKYGYELIECDNIIIYERNHEKYFKSYIQKLHKLKVSDTKLRPIAKLLMNSLFGKFAQTNESKEYKIVPRNEITSYSDWNLEAHDGEISIISKTSGYKYPKWVQPYISAIITAKARDYLYQHMINVGIDDLVYSDTDSLWITNFDKHMTKFTKKEIPKYEQSKEFIEEWNKTNADLGEWKIEDIGDSYIRGEKLTKMNGIIKPCVVAISGVPSQYQTEDNFKNGTFNIKVMNKIKGNLSRPERIGTFWEKPVDITKENSKINLEEEFAEKELYYEEKYH